MVSIRPWLDPKIPIEYIIGSFIVLGLVILIGIPMFKGNRTKKIVFLSLCSEYYFLVLCSTVICRNIEVQNRIELMPFWNYMDIWNKEDHPADLIEVLLNIALFVPIGLLLSGSIRNLKWWHVAIVGCCLSLVIEILQLITSKGLCETDDLIHNMFGAMIGWGMYVLIRKGIKHASIIR